jgi:hypothetical protein
MDNASRAFPQKIKNFAVIVQVMTNDLKEMDNQLPILVQTLLQRCL